MLACMVTTRAPGHGDPLPLSGDLPMLACMVTTRAPGHGDPLPLSGDLPVTLGSDHPPPSVLGTEVCGREPRRQHEVAARIGHDGAKNNPPPPSPTWHRRVQEGV